MKSFYFPDVSEDTSQSAERKRTIGYMHLLGSALIVALSATIGSKIHNVLKTREEPKVVLNQSLAEWIEERARENAPERNDPSAIDYRQPDRIYDPYRELRRR